MRKIWFCLFLLLTFVPFAAQAQSDGWQQLFNGKDLTGWKHVGPGGDTVEDGLIRTHGGMGLLYWTGGKLGNCVIRVVYKMRDNNDNSGVFIRIPIEPREEWMPVHYGYEVQIDNHPETSGEDEYHITGTLYSLTKPLAKPGKPGPEWNTMEITLDGPHTVVVLNGVKVTDYTEGDPVPEKKFDFEPWRGTAAAGGLHRAAEPQRRRHCVLQGSSSQETEQVAKHTRIMEIKNMSKYSRRKFLGIGAAVAGASLAGKTFLLDPEPLWASPQAGGRRSTSLRHDRHRHAGVGAAGGLDRTAGNRMRGGLRSLRRPAHAGPGDHREGRPAGDSSLSGPAGQQGYRLHRGRRSRPLAQTGGGRRRQCGERHLLREADVAQRRRWSRDGATPHRRPGASCRSARSV